MDTKCSSSEELSKLKGKMKQLELLKEEESSVGGSCNNSSCRCLQNNLAELNGESIKLDDIIGREYAMAENTTLQANDDRDDSTNNLDKVVELTDGNQGHQTKVKTEEDYLLDGNIFCVDSSKESDQEETGWECSSTSAIGSVEVGTREEVHVMTPPRAPTAMAQVTKARAGDEAPAIAAKVTATKAMTSVTSRRNQDYAHANHIEHRSDEDPSQYSDDECYICYDGGDLIMCDYCPKAFHLECHIPRLYVVPDGKWRCCECSATTRRKKQRCGECEDCLKPDCGECTPCLNKECFGGDGSYGKACKYRLCKYMRVSSL